MQHTHANDNDNGLQPVLHFKIRSKAMDVSRLPKAFDSVDEFCRRINRLRSKSDGELTEMGLDRAEIGAHVLQRLIN